MKFKLTLHKEFEVDTDKDWGKDLTGLYEKLRDEFSSGYTARGQEIADAITKMLAEDIETVVDLNLDETNFTVTVDPATAVDIPEDDEDC